MWLTAIGFIMIVILYCIFSLVLTHELYQPCKEFKLAGNPTNFIAGILETTGNYINEPVVSCRKTMEKTDSYEDRGKYLETKLCTTNEITGKSYITTLHEDCEFGCFSGICMPKCEDPGKDNIFLKSSVVGLESNNSNLIPGAAYPSSHPDYCTNAQGTEALEISKYLAKGSCDSTNFVSKNIVECSGICLDGACQKNPILYCKDSDQDDQGKLPGQVTYYNPNSKVPVTNTDSCIDNKTVTEYFCGKGKLPHKLILTCRHTCSQGQCIQQ